MSSSDSEAQGVTTLSGGSRIELQEFDQPGPVSRFWAQTVSALARQVGMSEPSIETTVVCVDRERQWRFVRSLRRSATIQLMVRTATEPGRCVAGLVRGRS